MCTKMASCYASLFMGKLEVGFLGSYDISHLIWLWFLDDIFMTCNPSKWGMQDFISKINNYQDTIKFTFKQSSYIFGHKYQNERKW